MEVETEAACVCVALVSNLTASLPLAAAPYVLPPSPFLSRCVWLCHQTLSVTDGSLSNSIQAIQVSWIM